MENRKIKQGTTSKTQLRDWKRQQRLVAMIDDFTEPTQLSRNRYHN